MGPCPVLECCLKTPGADRMKDMVVLPMCVLVRDSICTRRHALIPEQDFLFLFLDMESDHAAHSTLDLCPDLCGESRIMSGSPAGRGGYHLRGRAQRRSTSPRSGQGWQETQGEPGCCQSC